MPARIARRVIRPIVADAIGFTKPSLDTVAIFLRRSKFSWRCNYRPFYHSRFIVAETKSPCKSSG